MEHSNQSANSEELKSHTVPERCHRYNPSTDPALPTALFRAEVLNGNGAATGNAEFNCTGTPTTSIGQIAWGVGGNKKITGDVQVELVVDLGGSNHSAGWTVNGTTLAKLKTASGSAHISHVVIEAAYNDQVQNLVFAEWKTSLTVEFKDAEYDSFVVDMGEEGCPLPRVDALKSAKSNPPSSEEAKILAIQAERLTVTPPDATRVSVIVRGTISMEATVNFDTPLTNPAALACRVYVFIASP